MSTTLFVLFVFLPATSGFYSAGSFKSKAECEEVGQIYARHYCGEIRIVKPKGWR